MKECRRHRWKKIGIQKVPVEEDTEFAYIEYRKLFQVNRCMDCGELEKNFLWSTKKQVTWKDNTLELITNLDADESDDWEYS